MALVFRGPYALDDVIATVGPFTQVLMRPVESVTFGSDLMLTTIGLQWACGCQSRGTGDPGHLPACVLAACREHEVEFADQPERPDALGFDDRDPIVIPRDLAVGRMLYLRAVSAEEGTKNSL